MDDSKSPEISNEGLTEHERQVVARFGILPKRNLLLRSQVTERKFFDSGDFAISKASDDTVTGHPQTGKQHPVSGTIPRLSAPVPSDSNVKSNANASHQHKMSEDSGGSPLADREQRSSWERGQHGKFSPKVDCHQGQDAEALY
ncbi:uncharacterized protein A1O5_00965 [Cladophialophora psammophila CBS 110553]|uniref:mRNA stability protein n=1 Tax=Cladophialophora psammophila CBS 110553 TaxID=1182543 RepID=W9X7L2_9EURO|nr:uncharacterized protein A1O5_00965 [Cladophialophora psammophila CBS 110553]EXJ76457.1 hypothetical protein A1O5_00965 [Cladophialophora psammophila CBS 110553]